MVLHPSGPIAQWRFFHRRLPTTGAYRCLHQRLERKGRALRLDQEKGPPTPLQRQAYHSALIPGTSPQKSAARRQAMTDNKNVVPYPSSDEEKAGRVIAEAERLSRQ